MITRRSAFLALAAGLAPLPTFAASVPRPTGTWTGILGLGSTRLRLRFELGADGSVICYSVDQDNQPIAGMASFGDGGMIRFAFDSLQAIYVGRMTNTERIEGVWRQGLETPLTLLRGEQGMNDFIAPLTQPALDAQLRQSGMPALGAAASRRGSPPNLWVAGRRSIFGAARVTANDQWHLGSVTKSMTATLVARLIEAGVIPWDLCVGDVLGAIAPDMHATYRTATLRHLLSHRAGLPGDLPSLQLTTFQLADFAEIRGQRRRYARLALKLNPAGPIESSFQYSNNGYVVAATMLETVLGVPWEELMRTWLFLPLCLKSAGFGPPDAGVFGKLRQPLGHSADLDAKLLRIFGARGIRPVRPELGEIADNPRVLGPAGRVHMCLPDLLTYLGAHRDRSDFLRPASWTTLHTPPFGGDYAMGWVLRSGGTLWHNGSNNFWYAEAEFNPQNGVAAAAVCNEARQPAQLAVGNSLLRAAAAV
jgi:CubicO group peptidase (beta-lactamase class C family)